MAWEQRGFYFYNPDTGQWADRNPMDSRSGDDSSWAPNRDYSGAYEQYKAGGFTEDAFRNAVIYAQTGPAEFSQWMSNQGLMTPQAASGAQGLTTVAMQAGQDSGLFGQGGVLGVGDWTNDAIKYGSMAGVGVLTGMAAAPYLGATGGTSAAVGGTSTETGAAAGVGGLTEGVVAEGLSGAAPFTGAGAASATGAGTAALGQASLGTLATGGAGATMAGGESGLEAMSTEPYANFENATYETGGGGGTSMSGGTAGGAGIGASSLPWAQTGLLGASTLYNMYQNDQANDATQNALNQANQTAKENAYPYQQNWDWVNKYLNDPMSVLKNNPGYLASLDYLTQAGDRLMAGKGYNLSGNKFQYLANTLGQNAQKWYSDAWTPIRDAAGVQNYPNPAGLAQAQIAGQGQIAQNQRATMGDITNLGMHGLDAIYKGYNG